MTATNPFCAANVLPLFAILSFAGCAQETGEISRDSEPFDAVASQATIYTVGTEPFWGIEITPEGNDLFAIYTSPENLDGSRFPVTRFAGNNGLGFSGSMDGETISVALTPGDCSDGMSDRDYPFTATVAVSAATLYGCGYTSDDPFTGEENP
ncbi:hypothetical protein [Erythrobacter sp. Alg231-14]|uniref:hypothetical protein n=1 Tax=Erythrobacter sp. Alg231-14 TaxID=1922225 RepID=UPI000D55BAC0